MSKKNAGGLTSSRPGWTRVPDEKIPEPTFWPAALALGTVFLFWGSVTSWIVAAVGLILLAVSVAGWLGEIRHE
jgi:hypothetical protein